MDVEAEECNDYIVDNESILEDGSSNCSVSPCGSLWIKGNEGHLISSQHNPHCVLLGLDRIVLCLCVI